MKYSRPRHQLQQDYRIANRGKFIESRMLTSARTIDANFLRCKSNSTVLNNLQHKQAGRAVRYLHAYGYSLLTDRRLASTEL